MVYMGSKKKLMKYLNPLFNELKEKHNIKNFYDVFTGGANVISSVDFENKYANDIRKHYIDLFKSLAVPNIKNILLEKETMDEPTFNFYKHMYEMSIKNKKPCDWLNDNLMTLALSCATYSGKWNGSYCRRIPEARLNGRTRNDYGERINALRKQDFENITFTSLHYKDMDYSKTNSIFYFDPPYQDTTGYSNKFNHTEFFEFVKEKQRMNPSSFFLISELSAPDDFKVILEIDKHHGFSNGNKLKRKEKVFLWKE